jgi:hypothetical protein
MEPIGYPIYPFAVESYVRLGMEEIELLGRLGKEAEEAGRGVSKSGYEASPIGELRASLCRGNYYMYREAWCLLAQVAGREFRAGADRPTDEVA